jgi:hypothetical protein
VALNFAQAPAAWPLPEGMTVAETLVASAAGPLSSPAGNRLELSPWQAAVYRLG